MARRHSDSARELMRDEESDNAPEVAEHAASFVELLTRPGFPSDVAAAIYESAYESDLENWTPLPPQPGDREVTRSWIGRTHLGKPLEEAIRILGGQALWCALSFLDPRGTPAPTASLSAKIERDRIAIEVIAEMYNGLDERSPRGLQSFRIGLFSAAAFVAVRLRTLEGMLRTRVRTAADIRLAATDQRGARGPLSGPKRLRSFLRQVRPLTDAGWTRKQLAELVIDSGRWTKPPCRTYVADLLDEHGREGAGKALASRFTDAERRDAKRCK
jgi:hypothetical protein